MSDLSVGDVLIGEIQAWKRNQLELSIIATDAGRARWIPPNNNQLTAICLAPKVNFSSQPVIYCRYALILIFQKSKIR